MKVLDKTRKSINGYFREDSGLHKSEFKIDMKEEN